MNTSNRVLVSLGLAALAFTTAMIVIFCLKGAVRMETCGSGVRRWPSPPWQNMFSLCLLPSFPPFFSPFLLSSPYFLASVYFHGGDW